MTAYTTGRYSATGNHYLTCKGCGTRIEQVVVTYSLKAMHHTHVATTCTAPARWKALTIANHKCAITYQHTPCPHRATHARLTTPDADPNNISSWQPICTNHPQPTPPLTPQPPDRHPGYI